MHTIAIVSLSILNQFHSIEFLDDLKKSKIKYGNDNHKKADGIHTIIVSVKQLVNRGEEVFQLF